MTQFTFTAEPGMVFSDQETRTIRGLVVPLDATAEKAGRTWKFLKDSIKFADRSPLLQFHDVTRPVGKLVSAEWSDRGLTCAFRVSKTVAGDETLQLAADGVLGFSVGIDVPENGYKKTGTLFEVSEAFASETSVTPTPAFAGSTVDSVSFQKDGAAMPDTNEAVEAAAKRLEDAAVKIAETFEAMNNRPEPTVVPRVETVAEEAPYRFDGTAGKFSFFNDAKAAYVDNDGDSRNRIEKFLTETFVSTGNVSSLTPPGFRPDLYVDERPIKRPLASMVSGGSLNDINPFYVPKFSTAGNLVNPHVEGVEPTLATFTATEQLVEPHALSGKAEITRELEDKAGPAVDQMIWAKMVRAYFVQAEARIAALIAGASGGPAALALNGVNAALADDLDATFIDVDDFDRYGVLAASPALFKALATARDADGRKLFSSVNPSNGDGTRTGRGTLDLDGITAVKVAGLTDSFLIEQGAAYAWLQAPRKLTFDIQVKSIYIGLFGYAAEAVIDSAGVRKVTYAA